MRASAHCRRRPKLIRCRLTPRDLTLSSTRPAWTLWWSRPSTTSNICSAGIGSSSSIISTRSASAAICLCSSMSKGARSNRPISGTGWNPTRRISASSGPRRSRPRGATLDATQRAVDHLGKLAPSVKRVGVERAFLPADAAELMARELPEVQFVEAHLPLERLRARKTREELDLICAPHPNSWSIPCSR